MKKLVPILLAVAAVWIYSGTPESFTDTTPIVAPATSTAAATTIAPASFASGSQVTGSGTVVRVLADDNDGSRHQRLIIQLQNGQTLLVAHNIDLAPRVAGIRQGDTIEFYGEFESNPQGGVIHWTHRDPQARHVAGWLKHNGRTYQ